MAKCNISIDFKGQAEALMAKAEKAIVEAGGAFQGDGKSGSFTIPVPGRDIEGEYTVSGHTMNIEILEKPLLISCDRIENELREYLNQEDTV